MSPKAAKKSPWFKILTTIAIVGLTSQCTSSTPYEDEDYAYIDHQTRPQDDFYQHVNGKWLDEFTIPADKMSYGALHELRDKVDDDLNAIMSQLLSKPNLEFKHQQVVDVYQSYMDTDTINQLGLEPLKPWLAKISQAANHDDLVEVMAQLSWIGISPPVDIGIHEDAKVYDTHIVYAYQAGLGMPDRDYYLKDDEKFVKFQQGYKAYISESMKLAGFEQNDLADKVYSIELAIAKAHWDNVQLRDMLAIYNKVSTVELNRDYSKHFNWLNFLDGLQVGQVEEIIVTSPSYFEAFDEIFGQHSVEDWQLYLSFHLIKEFSPLLASDFEQAHFDFYGKVLKGLEQQEPRGKRALKAVNQVVGETLGEIYVGQHFPQEAKDKLIHMLGFVKQAFRNNINQNTWMQDETKAKALEKLEAMGLKIGYPDSFRDYSSISTDNKSLVENIIHGAEYTSQFYADKIGKPVDRSEWHMLPHTVNAYYSPLDNEIVFPAAILQNPFFDFERTDAENYGSAAAIIGHEISHGFDDQGRHFDAKGELVDWWTEQDSKAYDARTQQLVEQFNAYEPIEANFVNGQLTLGENIADLTGLYVAHQAYEMDYANRAEAMPGDYSPNEMFFMSWARSWRQKDRDDAMIARLLSDPHSPDKYRCNGVVSNLDAFYQTYNLEPGDDMYLPETKRVKLWF